ncbi:AsmA family protein [Pseudodesulfovibrio sp. zrk46]|uniref:AsmA family protein n=1 Tax=Pseudodesulfovibrio sp. zrk46 TaxID=2725288 RepID=UPI0014493F1C|nr:AsmA family protein [Pseudodesulfovibrio sp. zrk46]QJB56526.1 AsmA family protein [Pseudodesulfovibrio sp. zrk46]
MNKPLKIGLIVAGALVAFFVAAAILLVTMVDPNEYKGEIAKAVKESTGRELVFEGDISFNFFPWLGLKVGPVALGNAPGFQPKEMVRINKAEANIQIMPLLTGNVAIGVVVLDGFTLNLAVNKQGVSNWDDLTKGDEAKKDAAKAEDHGGKSGGSKLESLAVEGVEITNANVIYDDRKAGSKSSLTNLNLIVGEVGDKLPTPFELYFDLKLDNPKVETRPKLTGVATFDQGAGTFRITELTLAALNMTVTGDFFAKSKDGALNYSGELNLAEMSIKELMKQLSMEPLVTTDPGALTRTSAVIKINGTDNAVALENLTVKLDDTTLSGTGSVMNFAKPAIVVNLNVDDIDADRYMPPAQEGEKAEAKPAATQESASAEEPDLSALKDLNLKAKLTVGKVKAMNLRVSDILCDLVAKNGVVTIKPFSAKLYDGSLTAHSTLNANGKLATWTETADLKGVQAGPLLKDLTGKDHLLGTTVAKYDLTGSGLTPDNIKKSISGTASFAFTDGAINGINVAKMLRDAFNTIKGKKSTSNEPERTDFAELLGSAVLKNGHITNDDLLMKSPLLRLTGKGWANLPKNNLDYLATVTVVGTLKGQDGASIEELSGLPLPIKISGALDSPSFKLDAKAMAEALLKGTFKQGTKGVEENLKKKIFGGSKSGSETETEKKPGGVLKGLF